MKRIKNILSIIAVALFLSHYVCSTMFSHTHEFEWGRVTHSHPYVPQSSHSHSAAICSLIQHLSATLFIATTIALVIALFASSYRYATRKVCEARVCVVLSCDLRAPPVC